MPSPDFEAAWNYALDRLARELSPALAYHSLAHTLDEVVPAAGRLAEAEGVVGEPRGLLLTAAYFHDIGFLVQRQEHEAAGVEIVQGVLPAFGFDPAHITA